MGGVWVAVWVGVGCVVCVKKNVSTQRVSMERRECTCTSPVVKVAKSGASRT